MPFFRILLLALIFALPGCGGAVGIVNSLSDTDAVSIETGVAYGPGPRNRLDLYRPTDAGPDAPVVMFVYGGSWSSGDRGTYRFVGNALAEQGFVVAIPDYRVYPDTVFPGFVQDAASALAYVRREIADGRKVVLVGHSAGAHIASLLALDDRYLRAAGTSACGAVAGFVGLAGPYDFLPLTSDRYRRIFPEANRAESQPINFAVGRKPPSLLLHGAGDDTVEAVDSQILAQALSRSGNRAEARIYPGIGHIQILGAIAGPLRGRAPTLADISAFVRNPGPGC